MLFRSYGGVDPYKLIRLKLEQPDEWGAIADVPKRGGRPLVQPGYFWGGRELAKKGKAEGKLYQNHENYNMTVIPGPGRLQIEALHVSLPKGHHGWMLEDLTYGEIDARKQSWSTYRYLKENLPGFENAYIEQTPTHLGMRDSHRILGEYVLNEEDMLQGKPFDDSIAMCNFVQDVQGPDDSHSGRRDIPAYDIPYRCLVPKETENLLAAGSIISSDFYVWSSSRNMSTSMSTGQAAGTAAALAVKNNISPRNLDVKLLQQTLQKQGAHVSVKYIPQEAFDDIQRWVEIVRKGADPFTLRMREKRP